VLLRGRQGTLLELRLVGYQFPREAVDPWDSNSLLVSVRVVAPQGAWEVVDPCLTTWEAARVARWLVAVGRGADLVAGRPLGLGEPNVTLLARPVAGTPDRVEVRACFSLESRPPWLKAAAGSADLCVDLDVARADLERAAASVRADLARFPQRGDDPTL
jgi:hypothetical protein